MQRVLARGRTVKVTMETHSYSREGEAANISVKIPGRVAETVLVGAHFDSWDLGQGAIDNGLGVAQLYALARHLRGLDLHRSVELVWLDGEEQGLWGSRVRAAATTTDPIVAMVNLDMVGDPRSVNVLGADELLPALEAWQTARGDDALPEGVVNMNWLGSDHIPYQLAGVRTITFGAPINREAVRYYHDYADTMDKVYPGLLNRANGVIASLVVHLAQDTALPATRRTPAEIREAFTRFGLEGRLQAVGIALPGAE
jgi:Zn-dependent M28 family amino/carboxypeptidase